jgi:phage N-6-adenine-methyltransferase
MRRPAGWALTDPEFGTPPALAKSLAVRWAGGAFDLDVAASDALHVCPTYFTARDDGLTQPWAGVCYMNCPYGTAEQRWVTKARAEVLTGRARRVVALLPAKTGKVWWRRFIVAQDQPPAGGLVLVYPAFHLEFLPNKLRYVRPDGVPLDKARFYSVVVVFEDWAGRARCAGAQ